MMDNKHTDTHRESVIPIGFARQQWLCERALVLTLHVQACLVNLITT